MRVLSSVCAVIPTLNSQTHLPILLAQLIEEIGRIVVSDGGSMDQTLTRAADYKVQFVHGFKGRGSQLARGAKWAGSAQWYLFIHCDSRLPANWAKLVQKHIERFPEKAAFFQFGADTPMWQGRLMEFIVGLRNIFWHLPYGDQGLLISKEMYEALGGYNDIPLFEDVDLIERFKTQFGPRRLRRLGAQIQTDVSAYKRDGFRERTLRNFRLWKAYKAGENIESLNQTYISPVTKEI